jgi:Sec-independent protein secretion pathway component TatC
MYQNSPQLAKPAFAISNLLLFCAGMLCFYRWVQPARKGARAVVWVWLIMESVNVVAHFMWAALIGGYNPGLATVILFVPLIIYLGYSMWRVSRQGVAGQLIETDRT